MSFERQARKSRSSNRRHQIQVLRVVRTPNAAGDVVRSVTTFGPFWASVDPVSEKQRQEYKVTNTECTHFIRCNGRLNILETDEILFKGRNFEILTVVNLHEIGQDKLIVTKELRPKQAV